MLLNDIVSPANRVVAALLRSPVHGVASKGLMVLAWKGRLSGTEYSIPVGYQHRGDTLVVLLSKPAEKSWWKNFREPWPAEALVRGRSISVTGQLIRPDEPEFFDMVETTLRRLPWMGSQFGGVKYDKAVGLTDAQRETLTDHVAVVCFEPQR